jgi:hypothetical protein
MENKYSLRQKMTKEIDSGALAISGGVLFLLGLGVGFFLLPAYGGLAFANSLIGGIGRG